MTCFLKSNLLPILLLMGVRGYKVHDNFILIQVNHILKIISISHCVDLYYLFLYLIFKPFIFIYAIKTVTLFITCTPCNSFIFILNLEKVQSYRRNNSIQAGKVNASTWSLVGKLNYLKLKKVILPSGKIYLNVYMFRNDMKFRLG